MNEIKGIVWLIWNLKDASTNVQIFAYFVFLALWINFAIALPVAIWVHAFTDLK